MAESLQEARQTAGDSHLKNYLLQDVEIKTKSVETALAPLISQVRDIYITWYVWGGGRGGGYQWRGGTARVLGLSPNNFIAI